MLLLLVANVSATPAVGAADTQADTLTLILEELRQLRRSQELTALLQVKVQVAAERLRVREPHVRALAEQAGQAELRQTANAVDVERARAELARIDDKIAQEATPENRSELLAQRAALAETIGQMSAQDEDNQRRAASITESLAAGRAELDRQLEVLADLERTLERHVSGPRGSTRPQAPR